MTLQDVFDKCAQKGGFPIVELDHLPRHATSKIGTITTIKQYGVAVRFEGMKWDKWVWFGDGTDKRSIYTRQLKFR